MLRPPERGECPDYYFRYIDLADTNDVLTALETEMDRTQELLSSIPAAGETVTYEPGKWSVREVVGHVIDVERLFTYRAFTFARGDSAQLPAMDQDEYNDGSNAHARSLVDLASELAAVRGSTLAMFRGFADSVWTNQGIASGFQFTVRAFPYMMVGHEVHHRAILEEKYLPVIAAAS